jgi:outer membrane autotransporter protein
VLSPNARLEWEHQFRDNSRLLTGSLVADPVQQVFTVATDNPDRDYFNLAVGLAAQFAKGRAAFISYETVLGRSTVTNHAVTLGVRLEF